ncbi:MAG: exo-beta-1,3-glucanase [Actinomycetota bacterium]
MRAVLAFLFILVAGAIDTAGWWWFNRPVPVALSFDEPFPSVSFAPFRRNQSPLSKDYPPPKQIEEDLKSLAGVTKGVRTYTALEGMSIVPEVAGKYGMEVTHSAWLGVKLDNNEKEVAALIKSANEHPDTIKRVIVGNEVLLRNDLTPQQLIGYIRRVRAAVHQPVSYADVWAFWLKHPELAAEVDYITIHILPYWEDEPVAVEDAAEHLVKFYRIVQQTFPGKPILIGEAGWPTRGRSRGPAVASMENGARFVRALAKVSKENGFDYNVVEAFDQPWKAKLEGTVGANWGVVDADRMVKFAMSGPVEPSPKWPMHAAAAVLLGTLGALAFLRRPERYSVGGLVAVAALAQLLAGLAVWQAVNALAISYNLLEDFYAFARIGIHAAFAVLILKVAGRGFVDGAGPVASRWGERLTGFYGLMAIASTALIFFNGRYRDIPNVEFLVPCLGITAYGLARMALFGEGLVDAFAVGRLFAGKQAEGGFGPAKTVMRWLLVSALAAPVSESIALARGDDFVKMHPDWSQRIPLLAEMLVANHEMLVWSAMLLVMAVPFWAEWKRQNR